LYDLLVVLEGRSGAAGPVDEGPDRRLPGLHVRIVAVCQDVHLGERPFEEGRPKLRRQGVR
jgi:hypothetical protein